MRKITATRLGEEVDTIIIFESEEEREDYFRRGDKMINESQAKSLSDLRAAYMSNTSKARAVRKGNGKKAALEVFGSINESYKHELKKTYEVYAGARAKLRIAREKSLLEADLRETVTA